MAIAVSMALGARAEAIVPGNPDQPAFGLVGIARGQSARLNVSIGNPNLRPGELPPDPCHVMLGFVDASNQPFTDRSDNMIVGDGNVEPGGSLSLDIHAFDVFRQGDGRRKLLRAVVIGESAPGNPDLPPGPCRGLVSTLELLDSASGQTSVLYPPTAGWTAPGNPDQPAFGLVGLVRGQAAEIHVFVGNPNLRTEVAAAPAACQVSLAFVDEMGSPFMDRRGSPVAAMGLLMPGGSMSLSLGSFDVFRPGEGRRREIHAVVTGEAEPPEPNLPPSSCQGLVPTLEIVESQSGRTSLLYAPTAGWQVPGTPDLPAIR